jgi:serine protease Do
MEGRVFDAQVVLSPTDSSRGKLLSQYVCARIIRLDDVDLGFFDWDRHNTIYYFALNADEQIYLRYGGRDSRSPLSYLDFDSLELALTKGLELHRLYQEGKLPKAERPKPVFARDFPLLVERTLGRNACVECHLVADYRNQHRELDGTIDRVRDMYRSPDIRTIGIGLDVPRGLLVKQVSGAAQQAGMQAGDRITALQGTTVWTFGDFQYYYDKVDRRADDVRITVDRGGEPVELTVALPRYWWLTDLTFRHWSIEPRMYFESRPLTEAEKREHGLDPAGFASQVTNVESTAALLKSHELKIGDIVVAVDGVETDEIANTAELYMRLRKTAGETYTLDVLRDGQRVQMPLKTFRMSFRK